MKSELENFFTEPVNMTSREVLFYHKIGYDLKLAAARRNYDLQIFTPGADRDGYDIVLDDKDTLKKIQLKSSFQSVVESKKKSKTFKIHRNILRPDLYTYEKLGFESDPQGTGCGGGVILIDISMEKDIPLITYFYTDIFIIVGMDEKIIRKKKDNPRRSTLDTFYKEIRKGRSHDKINVSKSMFLKCKSPDHLLALMEFHSLPLKRWRHNFLKLTANTFYGKKSDISIDYLKKYVPETIGELIDDDLFL